MPRYVVVLDTDVNKQRLLTDDEAAALMAEAMLPVIGDPSLEVDDIRDEVRAGLAALHQEAVASTPHSALTSGPPPARIEPRENSLGRKEADHDVLQASMPGEPTIDPDPPTEAGGRPDCHDCGYVGPLAWHTGEPLWNFVVAGQLETVTTIREGCASGVLAPRAEGLPGMLCPMCFDRQARERGIQLTWTCEADHA